MAAKDVHFHKIRPAHKIARRQRPGRRGQGYPRPEGPQRGAGAILRRPDRHQGRRDRGQGNRAEGQVREHGRANGQGSRFQDLRRGRRRHHHRHRAGSVHPARRHEVRGRRHEPDGPEARHRQGRDRHRRGTEEAFQALLGPTRKSPRSARSRPTRTPISAKSSPRRWTRSARKA